MKILALLFLVGFATASIYDALDDEAEAFYNDFMLGLEEAGSLKEALDLPFDHPILQEAEDDVKTELGKRLKETLDEILGKMKDSLDQGKLYREDLQKKLDEIRAKLKELKIDMGEKAKELLEKVRERVKNFFRDLLDKFNKKEKRSVEDQLADFNFRELFNKLRDSLLKKIDKEALKAKVEEIFGKGSQTADSILGLIKRFGEKYREKLLDLVDRFLGQLETKRAADDVKTELGKQLRENLDEILRKMKESLDQGKMYKEDLQKKLEEVKAKLKELRIDMGEKAKEMMEVLKERVRNFFKDLLDKLKKKEKRSADDQLATINFRELFTKLRETLLKKIDKEALKAKVEEIFGKGSETADSVLGLIKRFGEKYREKLLDVVDRFLGQLETKRSVSEVWEKIKDYFKNLQIDLKEKYMKFGEWVKNAIDKGLKKGKDRVENIRNIAQEFVDHAKGVSKEVAVEALEFLKPYKEDLGNLWDQVKETVKDIVNRRD